MLLKFCPLAARQLYNYKDYENDSDHKENKNSYFHVLSFLSCRISISGSIAQSPSDSSV